MFDRLEVECRAGHKADETPIRFTLDGVARKVIEVHDRWYDPEADYFKVRADDDCFYLLRHDHSSDVWSLRYIRTREPRTMLAPPAGHEGDVH